MKRRLHQWALLAELGAAKLLGRYRPICLGWEVTAACPARCVYCGFREAEPEELTPREAQALIAEMGALGTRMVSLSGGEPLVRPDLPAMVAALRDHGITVSINTNGALVPRCEGLLRRVQRVKISLDGPPAVHDALRGAGTWVRAVRALDLCRRWSVPAQVQMVLTRRNLSVAGAMLTFCAERGIPLQVQPADPRILHTEERNPETPDPAELRAVLHALAAHRHSAWLLNSRAGIEHLRRWPEPEPMRCASGRISARISASGLLQLCGRAPEHAPKASWRRDGLAGAFARLHPVPCRACWCAARVDLNLGYQGRNWRSVLAGKISGAIPGRRPGPPRTEGPHRAFPASPSLPPGAP